MPETRGAISASAAAQEPVLETVVQHFFTGHKLFEALGEESKQVVEADPVKRLPRENAGEDGVLGQVVPGLQNAEQSDDVAATIEVRRTQEFTEAGDLFFRQNGK